MNPPPLSARILATTVGGLALAGWMLGMTLPLGTRPWQGAQSWWNERRFHQAAADQDYPTLLALGERDLQLTGRGLLFDYAIYRVAYGASAPSYAHLPADALSWARLGLATLEKHLPEVPNPWAGLQTQAYTLVERVFPLSHRQQDLDAGLHALADRWAGSGGPTASSPGLGALYRSWLQVAPRQRPLFLLQKMQGPTSEQNL